MADDPLTTLLVSEDSVARDEVADALQPILRFTGSGELLPERSFESLPAESKLLAVLLALKAQELLGVRPDPSATPQEIATLSGMPPGTVRPKLAGLLRARRVTRDHARYALPVHSIRSACELLKEAAP
jgi:hypothetical protein